MYVHIGNDNIIKKDEIVAILNLELLLEEKKLEDIIKEVNLEGKIINISDSIKKSLIIVKNNNEQIGYITNISSITLAKRIQKDII